MSARREAWRRQFAAIDPGRLIFLDETGATTDLTRRHGRAPRGQRVEGAVPHGHDKSVTLRAAVRRDGVGACLAFDGATNAAVFEADVEQVLVPTLRPGDIVVMDNLSAHKAEAVAELIGGAEAEVRYLPAYSPCPYPLFNGSGPRSAAASAPLIISWSLSQPHQSVIQPGSPSCLLPRKPPSLASSR